jgi:hypothetical protein
MELMGREIESRKKSQFSHPGGYGGLNLVERLDVADGKWVNLPELNPVRAQVSTLSISISPK